jgi:hypothetical protein
VVFAGYGLSVPDGNGQQRYNSYDGLDVKDKVVLLLRYVPEGVDAQRRAHLNRYAGLRYKVMMARERGAKGVLVVTGPNSPGAGEVLKLSNDGSGADSGLPAISISGKVADRLLEPGGKSLKELQTGLDNENPHAESGFILPGVRVNFTTAVEHIKKSDRNVVAALPGQTDEWVVIGAHYDHLGHGGSSSMAKAGEEGKVTRVQTITRVASPSCWNSPRRSPPLPAPVLSMARLPLRSFAAAHLRALERRGNGAAWECCLSARSRPCPWRRLPPM